MKWKTVVLLIGIVLIVGVSVYIIKEKTFVKNIKIINPNSLMYELQQSTLSKTTGELNYTDKGDGYIEISKGGEYLARIGFGVQGEYLGVNKTFLSDDFAWTWSKTNYTIIQDEIVDGERTNVSYTVKVFSAWNNRVDFNWTQRYEINPLKGLKMNHVITNNLGSSITNGKFWYIIQPNKNQLSSIDIKNKKIKFENIELRFDDLINNGFIVDDYFIGKGTKIGYPNKDIIALAVTKGNGTLSDGKTIKLDPTVTDFLLPTAWGDPSNQWSVGQNILTDNGVYTEETTFGEQLDTLNYSLIVDDREFNITLNGIEVRLEAWATGGPCSPFVKSNTRIELNISWDGGVTYTDDVKIQGFGCDNPVVKTYGSLSDNWGRNWTIHDFNDTNFRIKLTHLEAVTNPADSQADFIEVRISYTEHNANPPIVLLLSPPNASNGTSPQRLNYSVTDADNSLLDIIVRGTDNLDYMNESILSHGIDELRGNFSYNWRMVPVNVGTWGQDLRLLLHLNTDEANGENGTTIVDFSGNNFTKESILFGTNEPTVGVNGGSWLFDGDGESVQFGNGSDFNSVCDNGCTFMMVGRTVELGTDFGLGRYNDDMGAEERFFSLEQSSPANVRFTLYENGNATDCSAVSTGNPFGGFDMIVGKWDSVSNNVSVYLNGELEGTTSCPFDDINTTAWRESNVAFNIGDRESSGQFSWNGSIDEAAVWNRTLNDTEIAELFGLRNDTVMYWEVNATDSNNSAFNGTWQFNTPFTPEAPVDNCDIDCTLNPTLSTNVDCLGENLKFEGAGTVEVQALYTNWAEVHKAVVCEVRGWQRLFT